MAEVDSPFSLEGRRILVTGASGGVGAECAVLAGSLGARVLATGRNEERLERTLARIPGQGHRYSRFDLSDTQSIGEWMAGLASEGLFDGFVHCAGVEMVKPLRAMSNGDAASVMAANAVIPFELIRAFRQKKVSTKPSSIVVVSSIMSVVGSSGYSAYAASKAALVGMVRSLALEFASEGIRVNAISPGFVRTDMMNRLLKGYTEEQMDAIEAQYPLGFGSPADVASAAVYLLSGASSWITGTNLVVDGGYSAR
jgi:NAD(P)-dependent dehydrogenase (short-subunit alcohol dehydrogenase family)